MTSIRAPHRGYPFFLSAPSCAGNRPVALGSTKEPAVPLATADGARSGSFYDEGCRRRLGGCGLPGSSNALSTPRPRTAAGGAASAACRPGTLPRDTAAPWPGPGRTALLGLAPPPTQLPCEAEQSGARPSQARRLPHDHGPPEPALLPIARADGVA